MSEDESSKASQRLYRVDKFVVPAHGREEFLDRVAKTHAVLRSQDGFVQDFILEQQSGPGEFNFVTFVEWANADIVERVSAAVTKMYAEIGFSPKELISRLEIKADIANYKRLDI